MGSLSITQVPAAGTFIASGEGITHTVVITVDDGNGNDATCNVTLTGDDATDPVISACAADRPVVLDGSCELEVPDLTGDVTSTDNCTAVGSLSITQVPAAGTFIASGEGITHTVVITVDDGNGNDATCNVTLTGDDATDPVISACAADRPVVLDGSCELEVPDLTGDVTATDNCTAVGSLSITQVPAAGTFIASGEGITHTVVITVDDGNGNDATCNVTLTGDDATDPVISACAADRPVVLDGSCELEVPDLTGDVTATDNCTAVGSLSITQVPAAGTFIASGEGITHTVVITVDDGNGNDATCNVTLTGDDATDPVISACAADRPVVLDGSCELEVPDLTGDVTSTDNCTAVGSLSITQVPAAGTFIASGEGITHTVVITVDDGNGNDATCNVTLTGDDATDPVISACAADRPVVLDGSCELEVPDLTGDVTATDNCTAAGSLSITQVPAAGTFIASGEGMTHTVVITVDDGNGNDATCNVTLTGDDATDPVISVCPGDREENVDGGGNFTIPDYSTLLVADDNCNPTPSITQDPAVGTVISGIGTVQTITLMVDDGNGNSTVCSFDITLAGALPLWISCPENMDEYLDEDCQFSIPDYRNLAITTGDTGITQSPSVGTIISGHGTVQTIILTAHDGGGSTESCTFNISLVDSLAPVAVCKDITVQLDAAGNAFITAADMNAGSSDNCEIFSVDVVPKDFTCADIGISVVVFTVTDINGNEDTCHARVTVIDDIPPVITCPEDTTVTAEDGACSLIVEGIAPVLVEDNCNMGEVTFRLEGSTMGTGPADASGVSFRKGTTTVWYKVTDQGGNEDSCFFVVTVQTTIMPPENAYADRDTVCPGEGNVTLSYSGGDPGTLSTAVWYTDASFTTSAGTGDNLVIAVPDTSTTYRVRFESECDTTAAVALTVTVAPLPVPTFLEMTETACINGPLYRYVAGGQEGSTFSWIITNGTIVSNYNDTIYVDWGSEVNTGILELTETSTIGCVSIPILLYVDITGPSLELGADAFICMGDSVTIEPDGAFETYLWQDGSTGPAYTTGQGGWIRLEVSDTSGCTSSDSLLITEVELPVVDLGPDTTVCSEEGLVLDAGTDGEQYIWSTGDVSQQITVYNDGDQEIWVEVDNANGCTGTDTVLVRACDLIHMIDIPTGITPNDDGVNDVWNIQALSQFSQAVVEIFSQWGGLIWKSEPGYSVPWDGRDMRGNQVPVDSYHFVIYFNDGSDERYVGYITVIR